MSVSSPEVSLSSSSTTSSAKDDVDYWEVNPPPTPASLSRLNSMECWDYSIELDCLKGPEGFFFFLLKIIIFLRLQDLYKFYFYTLTMHAIQTLHCQDYNRNFAYALRVFSLVII